MRRLPVALVLVVSLLISLGTALLAPADAAAAPTRPAQVQVVDPAPVLVVGVPGLRWHDVDVMPTLLALTARGARGVLSVKAVPPVTCPADGWLTLGAGNRALAAGVLRDPCGASLPRDLALHVAVNEETAEGTELGALAEALEVCVDAEGAGPELAVLDPVDDAADCPVVLRETPVVTGQFTDRAAAAVIADRVLAELLLEVRAETVLVVGLSAAPGEDDPSLHVAVAAGPAFPPGALVSSSTRRAPYVQLVDVAPTVLDLLDEPVPDAMIGQPWRSVGEPPSPEALRDLAVKADAQRAATIPFFVVLLAGQLALVLLALSARRRDVAELVTLAGTAALGAGYLANLVPWWRSPEPLLTLLAVVVVIASLVAGAALGAPARPAAASRERDVLRPAGLVCGFVAAVIVGDLLTGAHLQMSSVVGYSPLVAGRFAGIGNVAFGVLAASALLATAALTRRAVVVAVVGLVVVAADGAPPWGSDVGGVLALVPAFAVLALLLSGRRVSLPRLLLALAGGVVVVVAFALLDWSRPAEDRTHLGRFVQDVVDGSAGTLLRRKAGAVLDLLFANPVTALLPLAVAAAVYLVVRPPAPLRDVFVVAPAWRSGLAAVGLASAVGFAVNDSGAAVPALALVVALPATAAVVLRARRTIAEPPSPASLNFRAAGRRSAPEHGEL